MIPNVERLSSIAEEHGTPAYVYDLRAVRDRVRLLRRAMPARVRLAYAVKANPSLAVLATVGGEGLGADVASAGELAAVRRAGIGADRVVVTGPGKRPDELAAAVENGVFAVTVESPGELDRLRAVCRRLGRRQAILLRSAGDERPGNVIGAANGRFGMQPSDLVEAARMAVESSELDLLGLHRFDASNVRDASVLLDAARRTVAIAAAVAREVDAPLRLIDLGGGLGIPYTDDESPLDVDAFGRGIEELLETVDADPRLAGAELLLEPGRFIAGPCGTYLVRVVDVKPGPDGRVVTVDGGIHHLLRPALVGRQHRIQAVASRDPARPMVEAVIGGPLCTSLDDFGRVRLPEPRVGDLLAVRDAGAYGFTESMPLFLSHPLPPEIVIDGDAVRVARPRIGPEAFIEHQLGAHPLTAGAASP